MKKSLIFLAILAVCLLMPSAFSSFGLVRANTECANEKKSISTSSIEISFGGDYALFSPVVTFTSLDMKGCEKNMLTPDDGDGEFNFRKAYSEQRKPFPPHTPSFRASVPHFQPMSALTTSAVPMELSPS